MINDYWLPSAIRYGISYKDFWDMTPKAIAVYRKVFEEKQQEEYDRINYKSWLSGMYVMNAIAACIDKKAKYPENLLSSKQSKNEELPDISAIKFGEWANAFNKNRKDGEVSG